MHPNYVYLLSVAHKAQCRQEDLRLLDYGCGAGDVVFAARDQGIDAFGAETFYEGGSCREAIPAQALGTTIREIRNGRMDFPDQYFDLVVCNQVFEHVEDLDSVLREICRVLKQDGVLVALFPTAEVFREGHIGIPFAHWFSRGTRLRYLWTLALRLLGLGYYKGNKSKAQWTRDALQWIDQYTYYRPASEIERLVRNNGLSARGIEDEFVSFRLSLNSQWKTLCGYRSLPLGAAAARLLFRRLGGYVLRARKINAPLAK